MLFDTRSWLPCHIDIHSHHYQSVLCCDTLSWYNLTIFDGTDFISPHHDVVYSWHPVTTPVCDYMLVFFSKKVLAIAKSYIWAHCRIVLPASFCEPYPWSPCHLSTPDLSAPTWPSISPASITFSLAGMLRKTSSSFFKKFSLSSSVHPVCGVHTDNYLIFPFAMTSCNAIILYVILLMFNTLSIHFCLTIMPIPFRFVVFPW